MIYLVNTSIMVKKSTSKKSSSDAKKTSKAKVKKTISVTKQVDLQEEKKSDVANADSGEDLEVQLKRDAEVKPKKEKKVIYLKQWLVVGEDENGKRASEFYLATCGLKAREAYCKRNGEKSVIFQVMQIAESEKTADWLLTHESYSWTLK